MFTVLALYCFKSPKSSTSVEPSVARLAKARKDARRMARTGIQVVLSLSVG